MHNYLIPANSKKSMLILGFFTMWDLIIFGFGLGISVLMLVLIKTESLGIMMLILSPALITAFLVMPVAHYHNVMTLIGNIYRFYTDRRMYYWKGWCVCDDPERRSSRRKNFK